MKFSWSNMEVNIYADSEVGALEYHVRSHVCVKFDRQAQTLIVPVDYTFQLAFIGVQLDGLTENSVTFTGIDVDTGARRKILIRFF